LDVSLEIYFQGHDYNVDRILKSIKASLSYFSTRFSPYQYKQVRVFELPRGRYAVALPHTIGYSEFRGFLARIDDRNPESINYPSLVAAHEIAHQWWGRIKCAKNEQP
jgi:ABC-2 type transport system permease protein